jgi:hypothetical protein
LYALPGSVARPSDAFAGVAYAVGADANEVLLVGGVMPLDAYLKGLVSAICEPNTGSCRTMTSKAGADRSRADRCLIGFLADLA